MLFYFLLCFISVFTGCGILRCARISMSPILTLTFAPIITLSLWILLLAFGVLSGFAIKQFSLPLWIFTFMLAAFGLTKTNLQSLISYFIFFVIILCLPILLMFPYFWHGLYHYPGAIFPDGWAYVAAGQ